MGAEAAFCSACGAELPADPAFCPECGDAVAPDAVGGDPSTDDAAAAAPAAPAAPSTAGEHENDHQGAGGALAGRTILNAAVGSLLGFVAAVILVLTTGPMYFLGILFGAGVAGWLQARGAGSGAVVGAGAGVGSTLLFAPVAVILALVGLGQLLVGGIPIGAWPELRGAVPELDGLLTAVLGITAVLLLLLLVVHTIIGAISGAVAGAIAED
jgi:hypothetical protein